MDTKRLNSVRQLAIVVVVAAAVAVVAIVGRPLVADIVADTEVASDTAVDIAAGTELLPLLLHTAVAETAEAVAAPLLLVYSTLTHISVLLKMKLLVDHHLLVVLSKIQLL